MARKSMPAPTGVSMRVSALASALALALAGVDAHALGLGGIRVQSALNQPFVGEIDLLDVRPDELDTVKVQIARSEEFSRVGAERYHYLTKLRFSPQISPRGNTVIRVSSREPVREPYMDFLVDVQWPKGRLVKEYTLLLDPPVTSARKAPPVKQPVKQPVARARSAPDPVPAPTASEPAAATTPNPVPAVSARAPASAPAAAPASAGGFPLRVGPVRTGSGLWRLALKNSPRGATVAQTAMALYRNNQGAFIQGDINRLLAGRTLVIPSSAELFALAPDAAQRELEAALRGDKVRQAPIADTRPDQPAAESAESRLKIAGAAAEDAKPSASAPPLAGQPPGNMEQELLLVRESSESTRQETLELRGRIRELEAQLGEIQQLLKLRNAELARIQGGSQAASALPDQVPVGPVAAAGEERMPDEAEPLPPGLENALAAVGAPSGPGSLPVYPEAAGGSQYLAIPPEGASGAESATDEVLPDQGQPVTGGETPADTAQADLGEQTTASGSGPDAARTPATDPPGQLEPEPSVAPAEQPPAGGSFWNQTWLPLAGMAGVLALGLGALGWARSRRRRKAEDSYIHFDTVERPARTGPGAAGPQPEREQGTAGAPDSTVAAQGSAKVDAPSSTFGSLGHVDVQTEEADILSEADIYIAYGRYREAEDLLRDEVKRMPERLDLKFKLAEAYSGARNYQALQGLMEQMEAAGADRVNPEHWRRLVDMMSGANAEKRPPLAATAGAAASVGPGRASREPPSSENLMLDLSGSGQASADLGRSRVAAGSSELAPDRPSLSRRATSAGPGPAVPRLGEDASPRSDVRQAHSKALDFEMTPARRDEDRYSGGASDLEISIDDLREAADVDLDSFLDSTRTVTTLVDDPTPSPGERSSARPGAQTLRAGASSSPQAQDELDLSGLLVEQEGLASSELLSSQWQMDSGLWDETATKLDLARAYVEMDDPESARGILEEVIAEGSDAQRSEARELLQGLG